MLTRMKCLNLFLSTLFGIISLGSYAAFSSDSVTLYTPFTKISVPPGEPIDYTIDVINESSKLQNVELSVAGMPKGWNYALRAGNWKIGQLSILPGEKKSLSLRVEVPLIVNKGSYRFKVVAGESIQLPLVVIVSEQGTFITEFTTKQANIQGHTNSSFTFNANLRNGTSEKQLYAFMAYAPRGWDVTFKSSYQQVTSVNVEPNSTLALTIDIKPPEKIEAGTYKIPLSATTSTTSANLELEVVITGTYKMELTTPTGLLSTSVTAGDEKRMEFLINNTGTAELSDIKLESSTPANWNVTFDPKKVDKLPSGKVAKIFATIKVNKKAIPGDYVTNIEAKIPETSSKASIRISVGTPMLWGWIGVLIIIAALGSVYYLFRKYGRR
jgi:uncharacterized membrane protein